MASSMEATKIFPSPILPVRAAVVRVSTTEAASAVSHHHLKLDLGKQINLIFGAAIDFRVALLASVSPDFGDRDALHSDLDQSVFYFVEFEGLDDCFYFFHGCPIFSAPIPASSPGQLADWAEIGGAADSMAMPPGRPIEEMTYSG